MPIPRTKKTATPRNAAKPYVDNYPPLRAFLDERLARRATSTLEPMGYLQVVSMSADAAKAFAGRADEPVDLGPADAERYKAGARVWGFGAPTAEVAHG